MSSDALLQGLYDSGGYEQGHAYLKTHAAEITPEFAARLLTLSLDLKEQSDPKLAAIFGELAIVAALLLGHDVGTGNAFYCKASILAGLGLYREAIALMDNAQAYLRKARAFRLLANCLYGMAICYYKAGDAASALRLLREVLTYQQDEKDRADSMAFMRATA